MKQRYLEVGRAMKDYEDRKYEQWKDTTELSLPNLMKKSLLTKVRPSTWPIEGSTPPSSRGGGEMAQLEACAPWVFPASERP